MAQLPAQSDLVGNLTDLIVLEQNWQLMIDEIWNTRQVNDYTGKNINKKDFMRSWTHSRTAQHISFDELLEEGTTVDGELLFDFVLFRDHGKAIARPYYYFKKLMKKCNIDCTKHVWHDLRHTYATLLDQNNMNMKVVSEILGHYSEEFTNEVYVIHKPEVIIYDTSEVMNSFIESLKLDSTERTIPVYDISFIQEYLF